jgi:multicomponent K+:H+ antiporter subunit D
VNHWPILPVLLPALTAGALALLDPRPARARAVGLTSCALLLGVAVKLLLMAADGEQRVYALGDWPPPFGIALVLDRLSALMVALTALLALACLTYAGGGADREGRFFHALFQFQLMGLMGAFLTGDLFNLFVFFEVLLIASYGLLLLGASPARLRAGLHYVIINVLGSVLFLIAVALLYALTGTLNFADLALKVGALAGAERMLAQSAALLLLAVFALKAALFPLLLWLPGAYAAASAPVAALFAIMTKVGVYAVLRVHLTVFPPAVGVVEPSLAAWLAPAALLAAVVGALGALASAKLAPMVAWLTVMSAGTALAVAALARAEAVSAALFYVLHSTLATAALFLLAGSIAAQRGVAGDRLQRAARMPEHLRLGVLFLVAAAAFVGIPPLSGFVAKVMLLQASFGGLPGAAIWAVLLGTTLVSVLALTRAGITVFWNARRATAPCAGSETAPTTGAIVVLLALLASLSALGGPIKAATDAAAAQLSAPRSYIDNVLRAPGRI